MEIHAQLELIKRGAVDIISEEELKSKLRESIAKKRPLRIKAGFDPTAPDLHLGHTVLLRKLRQFQDLGHTVFFLIGDFTGRIGDPSGKSQVRKQLTKDEVVQNAKTYAAQVSKILDIQKLRVVFNSEWFDRMSVLDILRLTTQVTVSQMLARADFKKRIAKNEDISLLEFMYPLLQGYDSVELEADIELGGTDQIFNLLVGRDIQKDFGQPQQIVITMPLLEGTDGIQKMSKSYGNYIGISEPAPEMFGKLMSISDDLMFKYYELLTDQDLAQIRTMHPKAAKEELAYQIVTQYHGKALAAQAKESFKSVFQDKTCPSDIREYRMEAPQPILEVLTGAGLVKSKNEARRLIQQGGVDFNSVAIKDESFQIHAPGILKAGSRRFLKIVFK